MSKEVQYNEVLNGLINKEVLVLGGFSGLGYKDEVKIEDYIRKVLSILKSDSIKNNKEVVLVGGATSDGIGAIGYKIAKEFGMKTIGIVSEQAKQWGVDKNCDETVYVSDPDGSWKVLDENGNSYFVSIAKETNGKMLYIGGGEVAVSEMKEAINKNVEVNFKSAEPNPSKCEKKGISTEKAKVLENYINLITEFPINHQNSYVQFKQGFQIIKE